MLTGVCPGCGLRADLDVFCVQAGANQALAAALALPPSLGPRVLAYLRLFSPPHKTLALGKVTRLLTELAATVDVAQVERRGLARSAPIELWKAALDAVLATPPERLPLDNHQYLFQVVWNLAERAAARQERSAEERLRQGQRPTNAAETSSVSAPPLAGADSSSPEPRTGEEALSSPAPRPARVPPPAEFRALLGKLGRALSSEPRDSTPPTEGKTDVE